MSFFKSIFKNYPYLTLFSLFLFLFFLIFNVFSWTLSQGNPPNNDLAPPLDTSSVEQTKSGNLILENNLTVNGLLRLGRFTSHPTGTNGALYYNTTDNKFYGYSNNSWQELGSGAGGGLWTLSGNDIYNTNSGNVGIGTTSPRTKLDCRGGLHLRGLSWSAKRIRYVPLLAYTLTRDFSEFRNSTVSVGTGPAGIAFDGTHIWVTNDSSNNVSKIDISTNQVVATVSVDTNPWGIAFDGTHIWVANWGSNNVSKILVRRF